MTGSAREFDIVLFGATGFVGRLTARHLAAEADPGARAETERRQVAAQLAARVLVGGHDGADVRRLHAAHHAAASVEAAPRP